MTEEFVTIQTGRYPRMLVKLGGVHYSLTFQQAIALGTAISNGLHQLSRELANSAVDAAINGVLGEVVRQVSIDGNLDRDGGLGSHDRIMLEAKGEGRLSARAFLDAIGNQSEQHE